MAPDVTPMSATETAIAGLWQISSKAVTDERGTIREFFRASEFARAGLTVPSQWTQLNVTRTRRGSVRGLHGEETTKLIGLAGGTAFGAYLDTRRESRTYGVVVTAPLAPGVEMLVPPGVCNGFQALGEDGCVYVYCFDAEWHAGMTGVSVRPTDPALGIEWPLPIDHGDPASISHKDATAALFADL
jgi:dTDP-4-dehydrorhamnose 3,5-epimerase